MKKVVIAVLCVGVSTQVNASISGYLRAAATGALTNSDFDMNYEVNKNTGYFPEANPVANNKEHSIRNIGARVSVGIQTQLENDWFFGGELNYFLNKAKHDHDFTEAEDGETNPKSGRTERISYININHKDELGISLKFGKEFIGHDIYGIVGAATKQVEIKYGLDGDHHYIQQCLSTNFKKRLWGLVFGIGASRKINRNLSCSLEYRYKLYNSSTKNVDWTAEIAAFSNKKHDISPRHFKVKSDNHELSVGFTLNI